MRTLGVPLLIPVLLTGTSLLSSAWAQRSPTVTVDQVMTAAEMRATGIAKLSPAERAAFERWLTEYTLRVYALARGSSEYAGVGRGHWIQEVSDGGRMVILEDGSIWEISTIDQIYTMLWLPITDITVVESRSPIGDFKYVLVNTDDGEEALAKYIGQR